MLAGVAAFRSRWHFIRLSNRTRRAQKESPALPGLGENPFLGFGVVFFREAAEFLFDVVLRNRVADPTV